MSTYGRGAVTGMAGTGYWAPVGQSNQRTRDHSKSPEKEKPRDATPLEVANFYLAKHETELKARAERERQREAEKEAIWKRNRELQAAEEAKRRAEQNKRELELKRTEYFRKMDEQAAEVDLGLSLYSPTAEEKNAVFQQMDRTGQAIGDENFSSDAFVVALLMLRRGEK